MCKVGQGKNHAFTMYETYAVFPKKQQDDADEIKLLQEELSDTYNAIISNSHFVEQTHCVPAHGMYF